MSDTPRTDRQAFGKKVMMHEMVHANFARELERENAELHQDKQRLEYLLREYNIYRFGYERLTYDDIDEAMGGVE